MLLKIFRVVWFLSVVALLAFLLIGYANWHEQVIVREEPTGQTLVARDTLFYILMSIFLIVNLLVYLMKSLFPREESMRTWFHGLVITINIFFIIALNLVGLYNSYEKFDYSRVGFMIYGSIGLIVVWSLAWPIYVLTQKFFIKQPV